MLNFHFCTKFQKQIEQEQFKQDLLKKLDTLTRLDDLKQNSSSAKVQTFAGETIFVFKYREMIRVLIEKRKIEADTVYFVRELIINAKEHFWTTQDFPRIKNGYWINDNPLMQIDIDNYCAIPKQERQINKKTLPYEKKTWLDDFKIIIKHHVFETEKWVEYVSLEDAPNSMQPNDQKDFHRLVKFIYEQANNTSTIITKETLLNNQSVEIFALQHSEYGLGIIYALFKIEDEKQLLLFSGANLKKQKAHWENIKRKASDYQQIVINSYDELAKNSLRSYPKSILNDFDSWLTIQSGSELSNLCLLQEQTKYLQNFRFPAYINAQAGSGKSTILYYLFAHTYWVKCMSKDSINQVGKVIFLTENEYLLNKFTKPAIKSLLSNNADLMGLPEEDLLSVDDCFATFKIFLWNLLDEDLKKDFQLAKYLDFSTFKNKYENAKYFNGKLKYTAEEAWFIINTYIRGYDNNKDIVNFEEIKPTPVEFPADFFTDILKEIYQNFYKKLLDDGYWDKAKAIRYINRYNDENPKYSAIFCDEAQDFSRASLEFIVQQSEFLEFDLADNEVVPIVFAGDHTQTVDPTGFSVARTKDIFYSQLKSKLQKESYTPEYNYRSARAVVNLANIIQYYRKKVLGIDIQKPQKSKKVEPIEGYTQNVFLSYEKLSDDTIKQKLRYKAFIIPTDASNKDNFLRENSFFEWNTENKQAVFHNIQTAIEAKGVDFKQVVVVGFGDFYLKEFQTLSWESSNFENIFEEKYFFNKLYVAITRAQNELIIVDSDEAYQQFWEKLRLPNQINDGWEDLKQTQDNMLIKAENIIPSKEEDEIESVNITKQQAIAEKNANGLRLVALRFYRLGNEKQYLDCLALSEELKGNWGEAAKLYEKLGLKDDILEKRSNCYFKAQQWEDLLKITTLKTDQHLTRCVMANLMTNHFDRIKPNAINDYKKTLVKLVNEIEWAKSLATSLIKYLTYLKENNVNFILTSLAIKELNTLTNSELHQVALLHFEVKNNPQAKEFWDLIAEGDKEKPCKEYLENLVLYYGQQGDIESKIISIGKLLGYKLSQIELQQYQDQVLTVATTQLHNLPISFAFIQVSLKVLIVKQPNENEILILITQLEKIALQENNIRLLKSYYENLLEEVILPIYLAEFIVERWAKSIILLPHKSTDWFSKLNEKYKEYAKLHQLNFQAFTEQELTEIITTPKQIHKQLSEHFEHITILNFRRFKIVELKNLGKFNLIVGDNNVGKTSLLEALLFTPDEQVFTRRLAYAYWERTHDFIPIIKDTFWEDFIYANDIQNYKMSFIVTQQRSKFEFEPNFTDLKSPLSVADSVNTQLIPFGKGFGKELAEIYYANIEDAEDEIAENFIKNMQSFIPNINRIIANAKTGEIKLREKGLDTRLPLHQYGEGANKLFRIILQMLLNKGGRILIDEIDAGIHFSRFAKFWEVILEVAAKNKIQVFATTHNLECVQYFKDVLEKENFKNLASQARTITLFQDKYKQVQARTRNFEAFQEAINEGYNIRGGE